MCTIEHSCQTICIVYVHVVHVFYSFVRTYSMKDGLLLKPTRPAMSLDSTFTQRAFGEGGPKGQLWAGYTMYENSEVCLNCY